MQFDDRVKKAVEAETSFAKRLQEIGQSPAHFTNSRRLRCGRTVNFRPSSRLMQFSSHP
jgi:hypothetical protein